MWRNHMNQIPSRIVIVAKPSVLNRCIDWLCGIHGSEVKNWYLEDLEDFPLKSVCVYCKIAGDDREQTK